MIVKSQYPVPNGIGLNASLSWNIAIPVIASQYPVPNGIGLNYGGGYINRLRINRVSIPCSKWDRVKFGKIVKLKNRLLKSQYPVPNGTGLNKEIHDVKLEYNIYVSIPCSKWDRVKFKASYVRFNGYLRLNTLFQMGSG